MLATGIVQNSLAYGGQGCPSDGVPFDEAIHHKLCEVGVQFPDALQYDTDTQSAGYRTNNLPVTRIVNSTDGTIYSVIIPSDPNNKTGITSQGTGITAGFGSGFFDFIDDVSRTANFGATLFLDTFTGGFVLDVMGTGILGVSYPLEFLTGVKILIGIAIASYFGYLFLGKPLTE